MGHIAGECSSCGKQFQGFPNKRFLCSRCLKQWSDEYFVVSRHRLRASRANLPATLTLEQWMQILATFHWKCAYCLVHRYEALEHFIPITLGGGTTQMNCVPACHQCNSLKMGKHPDLITSVPREAIERVRTYLMSFETASKLVSISLDNSRYREV